MRQSAAALWEREWRWDGELEGWRGGGRDDEEVEEEMERWRKR